MPSDSMRSESWLIIELGGALVLLALISFFYEPKYEKAVWFIMGVIASQFANVVGYKFGRSLPQQVGDPKAGQSSSSEITSTVKTEAPPQ